MSRALRWFGLAVLVLALLTVGLASFGSYRPTAGSVALAVAVLVAIPKWRARLRLLIVLVVCFVLAILSPVELSLYSVGGGPRLMRLQMGLVLDHHAEEPIPFGPNESSNVFYGGDVVWGFEPKWLVVW